MTHDVQPPAYLGRDRELLAAPRLDNLLSVHAGTAALAAVAGRRRPAVHPGARRLRPRGERQRVRHRRPGPAARQRAGALGARARRQLRGPARALAGTVCVSSDIGHAVHPNYAERHDPTHHPRANGGPILKVNVNQRYATDGAGRGRLRRRLRAGRRAVAALRLQQRDALRHDDRPDHRGPARHHDGRRRRRRSCPCTPPANCAAPTTRTCWPARSRRSWRADTPPEWVVPVRHGTAVPVVGLSRSSSPSYRWEVPPAPVGWRGLFRGVQPQTGARGTARQATVDRKVPQRRDHPPRGVSPRSPGGATLVHARAAPGQAGVAAVGDRGPARPSPAGGRGRPGTRSPGRRRRTRPSPRRAARPRAPRRVEHQVAEEVRALARAGDRAAPAGSRTDQQPGRGAVALVQLLPAAGRRRPRRAGSAPGRDLGGGPLRAVGDRLDPDRLLGQPQPGQPVARPTPRPRCRRPPAPRPRARAGRWPAW